MLFASGALLGYSSFEHARVCRKGPTGIGAFLFSATFLSLLQQENRAGNDPPSKSQTKGRLAPTPVLWGLRFPEGTCGSPRPTTKSRGPTEQVRATIAHLSRLIERHAAECQVPGVRFQMPGFRYQVPGTGAGAGRYERCPAPAFCLLPSAYRLLPRRCCLSYGCCRETHRRS